jgi:hypothetical protein
MRWRKIVPLIVSTCALVVGPWCQPATAQDEQGAGARIVAVVPEETDAILANPGMGWETFHRTCQEDRNLPAWIPSTVQYARWGWGVLEPKPGEIDFAFLDNVLRETRAAGQKLAFRVMCCSTTRGRPYQPAWLSEAGGRVLECTYHNASGFRIPDLDDPATLKMHLDFIRRLGRRYDGHPDLDHVDLGSVGWWGEWHMSGSNRKLPTLENRKKIIDAYLEAFRQTPLLMLIGGGECLRYATQRGTGWRADCLGDMGGFSRTWCHMRDAYPIMIPEAGAQDTWKTAPVAWETCWDMRKWVSEGWPLRTILDYALAMHGSYLNNKSAPLPEGEHIRPEIERFLRRLGYRLVLKELRHASAAKAGQTLSLAMKWQNVGSAPCYKSYRLAYRLTSQNGYQKILVGTVTVERWLPGSIEPFTADFLKAPRELPPGEVVEVSDAVTLPKELPAGEYVLSVGVVGQDRPEPVVTLGITGRDPSGWYPLSRLRVTP